MFFSFYISKNYELSTAVHIETKLKNRKKHYNFQQIQGLAYLGEYPLCWAACLCNETVYNLLVETGADPDAQVKKKMDI